MSRFRKSSSGVNNSKFFKGALELPLQLQKELGIPSADNTGERSIWRAASGRVNRNPAGAGSRKERRRAERGEKKLARGQKSTVKVQERNKLKDGRTIDSKGAVREDKLSIKPLKSILKTPAIKTSALEARERTPDEDNTHRLSDSPAPFDDNSNTSRSSSPQLRLDASSRAYKDHSVQEDAEIAALEKKLGRKGKTKNKSEEGSFEDLLGGLDEDSSDAESKKRKRAENEWLQGKRRKVEKIEQEEEPVVESGLSSAEEFDGLDGNFSAGSMDSDQSHIQSDDEVAPVPRVRENPYVPPVPVSQSSQKYVPPSLRKASDPDSENLIQLRRQIQGLLNKISEANLISILQELERLYSSNPRQSVTTTFLDLLLNLICDPSSLQNTFIILHAGFAAGVYKVVGTDYGAELIAKVVSRFDSLYQRASANATTGKETSNIISFLSHLYTYHVTSSVLIFDYVRLFLTSVSELNTELLLKIVRDSGPQLRQDDPSSLKDIVLTLQKGAAQASATSQEMSVRTKFMIETITDLKNNKLKAGTFASSLAFEHITRMRKTLSSLGARQTLRATEPLRISLTDIRNRDKRGQWWLVGASWKDPSSCAIPNSDFHLNNSPEAEVHDPNNDNFLLSLSPSHFPRQIHTPTRRAIFTALISSSDYVDAVSRLRHLRLKRTQEMEIPRVLLYCVTSEGAYNPYYALVAREWCREGRRGRGRVGMQFALWGVFRRWGEHPSFSLDDDTDIDIDIEGRDREPRQEEGDSGDDDGGGLPQVVSLAKLFASLILSRALPLSVLKTVDFWHMGRRARAFCEVLFLCLFVPSHIGGGTPAATSAAGKGNAEGEREEEEEGRKNVEGIFGAVVREAPQMVAGVGWFLKREVRKCDLVEGKGERRRLGRGVGWAVRAMRNVGGADGGGEGGGGGLS